MKEVYFTYEIVTGNTTLVRSPNLIQVGFINYSEEDTAFINGFPLYPIDKTPIPLSDVNLHIMWMPVTAGEKDVTQYKIDFGKAGDSPKLLYVLYKLEKTF